MQWYLGSISKLRVQWEGTALGSLAVDDLMEMHITRSCVGQNERIPGKRH